MERDKYDEDKATGSYTEVYVWGGIIILSNIEYEKGDHYGQLGLGHKYTGKTYPEPKICSFNLVIREVSCGEEHAAFITFRGHIYTMGSNTQGRLGIGNKSIRQSSSPCLVEDLVKYYCRQISCGWGHTIAVMEKGEAFSWGVGEYGALGNGSTETIWSPAPVSLDPQIFIGVKKASAGTRHSAFISEFGGFYTCGSGEAGQLGDGKRENKLVPEQVSFIAEKCIDVAAGIFHTLILTESGRVYATGGNTFGQLGTGTKKNTNVPVRLKEFERTRVVKIACGHHSAALTEKGELYIWGTGIFGEYLSPVKYSQNGIVYKDLSVGGFFGSAVDEGGLVWTWGSNTSGELGQGDFQPRTHPTPIGYLQGKRVQKISCGGSFVIALGETKKDKLASPPKSQDYASVGRMTTTGRYDSLPRKDESFGIDKGDLSSGDPLSRTGPMRNSFHESRPLRDSFRSSKPGLPRAESVGRVREYESSDKYSRTETKFESTGGVIESIPKGTRLEDPFVDLLLKQKALLENSLRHEREERRILENNMIEMKRRVRELQEGPDGLIELSESLNKQARRFEELKQMYDEECLRKERVTQELFEARKTIDGLQLRIAEREKTILMLEQRVYDVELALKEKVGQFEDLRKAADLQNEKHIEELSQRDQEISRLNKVIKDLTKEYEKAGTTLAQLEKLHNEELAHKRVLENETGELTKKIKDLLFRLDENAIEMEKERRDKAIIEAELVACKQREEENSIRMREMRDEIARLKNTIQQSIENEQEKNTRFREEKDYLTATLGQKDAEIDELRRRLAAMEQNLYESEDKNKRLVELLNQEIHKQAEEFKKKALTTLFAPAKRLAENIVNTGLRGDDSSAQLRMEDELEKLRAESEAMKEEEKSKSPLKTEPKPESSPEKLRRIINQEELPKAVKEDYDNYPYPSFPTHKDDKTYGDSSFRGSVIDKTTEEIEESRRKLSQSANKLLTLLEIGDDQALPTEKDRERASRFRTPTKNTPQKEDLNKTRSPLSTKKDKSLDSTLKSKPASPFKSIREDDEIKTDPKTHEYIQNLREVKERLASLQKNKMLLEHKMSDFEKKLQNIK